MVVAALLVAPTLFVVALLNLAGPSTRAALAGDDPAALDDPAAPGFAASVLAESVPADQLPLSSIDEDDSTEVEGLAPIFEPRIGRFRLNAADPADDDHGHDHGTVDGAPAVEAGHAGSDRAAGSAATGRTQSASTPIGGAPGPLRASAELPILMYHYTGPLPSNPDVLRRDLTVSPALFEGQLQSLVSSGVETVTLDRIFEHLEGRQPLPTKAVALTFDDGYLDNYEVAFPLLKRYGMVGTFFVATGLTGRPGYMTWEQLDEMAAAGMAIEAHSITHADLTKIAPAQLARELAAPKQQLEERLGRPVRFLAYPAGRFDPAVIRATRVAGYTAAVTTQHGYRHTGAGPFELNRVRVRGTETVEQLVAKLTPPAWRTLARQP